MAVDILGIDDLSKEDIEEIFSIADDLKAGSAKLSIREGSVLALLFQEPSINTRLALEVAISKLGGRSIYLPINELDEASILRFSQGLGAYAEFAALRVLDHDLLQEFAKGCSVPVINALSDLEHPLAALSILYTLRESMQLKGLRLGIIGNPELSVVNSLMLAAVKLGAKVAVIGPEEMNVNPIFLVKAREYGIVDLYTSLDEGLQNIDAAYLDYFVGKKGKASALANFIVKKEALESSGIAFLCSPSILHSGDLQSSYLSAVSGKMLEQNRNRLAIAQAAILSLSEKNI